MDLEKVKEEVRRIMNRELGIVPRVKVFAFGGGGNRIADYLSRQGIDDVKIIAINADGKVYEINANKTMHVGKEVLGVHTDTNGEVRVAEYIIDGVKAWILEEARNADVAILVASLGGGMGTGGLLETLRILKKHTDVPVLSIAVLPFSFEKERRDLALKALQEIKELSEYIILDSDAMLKTPGVKVTRAYEIMYENIYNIIVKVANRTRTIIERKFEEIYLQQLDAVVEEKYTEIMNEASVTT